MRHTPFLALGTAIILTGLLAPAHAQDQGQSDRGVARVSVISGEVSIQRGDSGETSAAAVNAVLVAGDTVATGAGSRAEIQFDNANMARLASDSEVRLSELTPTRYQLQVARGTVMFSVVRDSRAQVEVSTPLVSVRPTGRGAYRISVFDDGRVEVTSRAGNAEIYTPRGVETVHQGSTMTVQGDPSDPQFQVVHAIAQDDFDQWNASRDQNLSRSRSYQYVSPEISGADDLDASGRWVDVPEYGRVWNPSVGAEWAPYRNGRWVWTDFYGWTWVDDEPWGWAPFHYGRWFWGAGYGWCWFPGPRYVHPYWSPALVAFFGFGGFHVGFGFGGGGFGWVPLGPFEACHPWWGRGFYGGYRDRNVLVNNINISNNVNITNMYRNARVGNGVTAVNGADFGAGRVHNMMRLSNNQLQQASLVKGQVPIAPTNASLRFSDRAATAIPRGNVSNGRFFSHNQPPQINRVPFAQQQRSLEQISRPANMTRTTAPNATQPSMRAQGNVAAGNMPRAGTGVQPAQPSQGSIPPANAMRGSQPSTSSAPPVIGGWRRFGSGPATATGPAANAPRSVSPGGGTMPQTMPRSGEPSKPNNDTASRGWQRFGETQQSPRSGAPAPQTNGGWRQPGDRPSTSPRNAPPATQRFQSPSFGAGRGYQPNVDRPAIDRGGQQAYPRSEPRYNSAPQYNSSPRYESPRYGSRQAPLQIAPPIVRERSTPSYAPRSGGSFGGSYNGGGRSQPAPRSSSGYSGGSHGSYGGGGGRSSGGGSTSHSSSGGGGSSHGGSSSHHR